MKGYKIFDQNWRCRGFQYAVGETATTTEVLVVCKGGLHFCTRALDCLQYYNLNDTNHYAEVEAVGDVVSHHDKFVTNRLLVVRELTRDEFAALCHGTIVMWHDNGAKYSEHTYVLGERHGRYKKWHDNGAKSEKGNYEHGLYHGVFTEWHQNGNKTCECIYVQDKLHGPYTEWRGDETKESECHYENGQLRGSVVAC